MLADRLTRSDSADDAEQLGVEPRRSARARRRRIARSRSSVPELRRPPRCLGCVDFGTAEVIHVYFPEGIVVQAAAAERFGNSNLTGNQSLVRHGTRWRWPHALTLPMRGPSGLKIKPRSTSTSRAHSASVPTVMRRKSSMRGFPKCRTRTPRSRSRPRARRRGGWDGARRRSSPATAEPRSRAPRGHEPAPRGSP